MKQSLKRWPTVVDLFCGCGGVTEGSKRSRFRVVAAVDNDPVAARTYRKNHPRVRLFEQDIKDVDPFEIRRKYLDGRNLDVLVICAPCQPFSSQNGKSLEDRRAKLILSVPRFTASLRPAIIFFENVPGLRRKRFSPLLTKLQNNLRKLGYVSTGPREIDAADYGVPQRRRRYILIATRRKPPFSMPEPGTPEGKRITVRRAIGRLSPLRSGESHKRDPLHFARNHKSIALKRLRRIPENGGSRHALPKCLQLTCHKDHEGHPDVYGRMEWDNVAPTLTTGCTDVTRGRFAHPRDCRAITLREAARLQTFPDDYCFIGSAKDIAIQIGNAVPVQIIEALFPFFRDALRN